VYGGLRFMLDPGEFDGHAVAIAIAGCGDFRDIEPGSRAKPIRIGTKP
jgi:hypothetical protein